MSAAYTFERQGRSRATVLGLVLFLGLLVAAWIILNAAFVVVVGLSLFSIPAILDLIRNPKSGMRLDEANLHWYHGRISNTLPRAEIERIRIDLRMDRSLKMTAELKNGKKIRVIQPAIPPLSELEKGLEAQGMPYQKHPFSFM